ncbi:MAG: ribosome maturation factor RimM [Rickettsiaceae bacterium]|nr:MAG: ribosome maturation factor RimM [Rickettsiaceae bacterium]
MQELDKSILVGFISSCFGIKGEVIVNSLTVPVTNICKLPLFNQFDKIINIKFKRQNSKGQLICSISDITSRNEAELLLNTKLFCKRSNLPQIANNDDEYYIEDLKGVRVIDNTGQNVGQVKNIFNFGAGDILEIEFLDQNLEMFPFDKQHFPKISAQYIVFNRLDEQNT